MKRLLIVTTWFSTSIVTLLVSVWAYSSLSGSSVKAGLPVRQPQVLGEQIIAEPNLAAYAAVPVTFSDLRTAVKAKDARPLVIENYLERYRSPMAGQGQFILDLAKELGDEYKVDPTYLAFMTIAIGQNESNLGKKMPPNCYNAWGYGIHAEGTLCFENWEEGITRFMTGLARDYIDGRGLETPEEIMTRYTPHSPNGAWAKSVNQFLDDLYQGNL